MMQGTLLDTSSLARQLRAFGEPPWLLERRTQALEAYLRAPQPPRARHLWRYSDPSWFAPALGDLAALATRAARASEPLGMPEDLDRALAAGELSGAFVERSGFAPAIRVAPEAERRGVVALDLRDASRSAPEPVEELLGTLLGSAVSPEGLGKFEALNLAFWHGGAYVYVPKGARLEAPIYLRRIGAQDLEFWAARTLFVLEEGAEVTLIEEHEGDGAGISNAATEIFAAQGSSVRHVFVQRLGSGVRFHASQRIRADRDARALTLIASLGSAVSKCDFGSRIEGPGANAELYGFLFGDGRQHFDHHTAHEHRAHHTSSDLHFHAVVRDQARSAYTGLIRIEREAPGSEAYQENRNLALGDGAKAESIPELEILTDDVRCTHGATVGSLDPEQIFYLRSRGIEPREAARLVVEGFLEPATSRLPEAVRDKVLRDVQAKMARL